MKPCWKVIEQKGAWNMNNVYAITKCEFGTLFGLNISHTGRDYGQFNFLTESERDEAFEYLMRDDEHRLDLDGLLGEVNANLVDIESALIRLENK